jgi:tetratricopeptide (TPR) repeat protein
MAFAFRPALLALATALMLAACDSAEERAEKHYQTALELLAQGDEERAALELRNVFQLNGFHKEARETYATLLIRQGKQTEAYGQYLRLIEQYPDTVHARRDLAQMALLRNDWQEVERHGSEALRLAPEDPTARAIRLALDYRAAVTARDTAAEDETVAAVTAFLEDPAVKAEPKPEGLPGAAQIARRILIGHALARQDLAAALPQVDAALAADPDDLEFNMLKLQLLAQSEDIAGTGAQLKDMVQRFPDNDEVKAGMIGWYLAQQDIDGAEAFLREEAGALTADPDGHVAVIQLLKAARGEAAARTEIETLLKANEGTPNADLYGALLATLDFEGGKTAEAVAAMETILAGAGESDQTNRLKLMLARMLEGTGNAVGARARIEEVLAKDPNQVEALKLRAAYRIQADDPGGAIVDLRTALDQAPRDAEILTLMAEAHERDGAPDLAAERLALAVEVSGNRAEEALRYAGFLAREGRTEPAIAVLLDARRANPGEPEILRMLAQLYLTQSNWAEAEAVTNDLAGLPQPEAKTAAQELKAAILLGQNRVDEGLSFLSEIIGDQTEANADGSARNDTRAVAMLLETQVRQGRLPEARAYLDGLLIDRPEDRDLQLLSAGLDAMRGDTAKAEAQYRDLIAADPAAEAPVRLLYALLTAQDRRDEAAAVVETALQTQPKSGTLRWLKAGDLEKAGDIDGAIAIYEQMYAEDSGNVIVANNLASMITTYKSDPESLDRAFAVARRLRGSDVPAFADTYGWIVFRRGDIEEALAHLERAAPGLPGDAMAQYHLGMAYEAAGRKDEARRQFALAIEVAGPDSTLPQIADARTRLAALGGPPPAPAPAPAPAPGAVTP